MPHEPGHTTTSLATNLATSAKSPAGSPNLCPECGGLDCLCRPRFFAGQLLTDEELNGLEQYVINKNKLHNRYLHGWGVVCGLEVFCHSCDNFVTVTPGYALSPCGDDIIVCKDDKVDVCALINKCRDQQRRECEPPRADDDASRALTEDWVLAIRYVEQPARGLTALRASTMSPESRCGCGGSSSGGCGCHETAKTAKGCGCNGATTATAKNGGRTSSTNAFKSSPRSMAAQCEPSLTCESYGYEVYKAPRKISRDDNEPGALAKRFLACYNELIETFPTVPGNTATTAQIYQWALSVHEWGLDFFAAQRLHNCQAYAKFASAAPEPPLPRDDRTAYLTRILAGIAPIIVEYLRTCQCSVILPPCPDPVDANRVPLATITVTRSRCKVVRVCNIGPRKFAATFPNLQYWLSVLPYGRQLRASLESLCCQTSPAIAAAGTFGAATMRLGPQADARTTDFGELLFHAFTPGAKTVDVQTLFMAAIGATGQDNKPLLSELELKNPVQTLLLHQLARPLFAGMVSPKAGEWFDTFASRAAEPEAPREDEIRILKSQLAELQQLVEKQQENIDKLTKKKNS